MEIHYKVLPTFAKVHRDTNPYLFVMGPVGSGKSTGCIMHAFLSAMKQRPDEHGVRHYRHLVVRATYPALKSTVIKTWQEWFKDKITFTYSMPIVARIQYPLSDGTRVDMEVLFIAVEDDKAAEKLRSLEVTSAHINEASEITEGTFNILKSRFGRFPSMKDGGPVDPFIISDYNAVSTTHWLYKLAEETKPEKDFSFYKQPPAVLKWVDHEGVAHYRENPEADNIKHLRPGYYDAMIAGTDESFIQVNLMNNYGEVRSGRPVYKDYNDIEHVTHEKFTPLKGVPVVIGVDLGLTPAAAFTQQLYDGTVVVFDEIVTDDCSIQEFGEDLLWPTIQSKYPQIMDNFKVVVDPAAQQRAMTDARSSYSLLKSMGLPVRLARTNNPRERISAVIDFLRRRSKFKLCDSCINLRKGFIAEYKYKPVNQHDTTNFKEKPEKNEYSHIHDALQYAMLEYFHKPKGILRQRTREFRPRYEAASAAGGY